MAKTNGILLISCVESEYHDRPDRFALVHQVEDLVDLLEFKDVSDHRVDLDLSVHVPVDDFRHVGAAARAAERGAFPGPAGDPLERAGGNFLPDSATPVTTDTPEPRWQASSA